MIFLQSTNQKRGAFGMEIWDIYDENRVKTGKTVRRGQPMAQDEYHLVVHVWIKNSNGQYLISKRTPNKTFPLMWESTGGSATTGENSLEAALREVKEEIGITLNPNMGKCVFRFKRQHIKCSDFLDVYLFEQDININDVVYQEDEVCGAKLVTKEEILNMIDKGEFVAVFKYLNELFNL